MADSPQPSIPVASRVTLLYLSRRAHANVFMLIVAAVFFRLLALFGDTLLPILDIDKDKGEIFLQIVSISCIIVAAIITFHWRIDSDGKDLARPPWYYKTIFE